MIIEQAILTELNTFVGLIALVGTRIYYIRAPQAVIEPYIVFFKVSAQRGYHTIADDGIVSSRFQFSVFSTTYYEAKQITAQISLALPRGPANIGTTPGVDIGGIFYNDETDLFESETQLFHIACDYLVNYYET